VGRRNGLWRLQRCSIEERKKEALE
jgi:hypothetical protein